jgi:hypothetical protein
MSAVYETEQSIKRRTRNGEKLGPVVFVPEDVVWVASLYWKIIPFDNMTQFGREYMPKGTNRPRDIANDPVKYPPVFMKIQGAFVANDQGDDKIDPAYTPAIVRAEDIARRYAEMGVFIPANGLKVTKDEVAEAYEKLKARYRHQVDQNNDIWAATGQRKDLITTGWIGAQDLGVEAEWADQRGDQEVCQYCGRAVRPKAVKCGDPTCGGILDWARAYQGGIVSKEAAQEHGVKL